jgi:hypothetical protein
MNDTTAQHFYPFAFIENLKFKGRICEWKVTLNPSLLALSKEII